MKRVFLLLTLCVSLLFCACAEAETIPSLYQPILDQWGATNGDELRKNICQYWMDTTTDSHPKQFLPKYYPATIRFGGTTEELIQDKKNWDLAIVSSKEVDLFRLAEEDLISKDSHFPDNTQALRQWLLPEKLQELIPTESRFVYSVFVYDYHEQTDEAIFLITQPNTGRKFSHPRAGYPLAEAIMDRRPAANARATQGIAYVEDEIQYGVFDWTVEKLLSMPDDWDVACLSIKDPSELDALDQAGLLYDLSQDAYLASRQAIVPYAVEYPGKYLEIPKGLFSQDGRMIAIPSRIRAINDPISESVVIVNARSQQMDRCMTFVQHLLKSWEWWWTTPTSEIIYDPKVGGMVLPREEVTW